MASQQIYPKKKRQTQGRATLDVVQRRTDFQTFGFTADLFLRTSPVGMDFGRRSLFKAPYINLMLNCSQHREALTRLPDSKMRSSVLGSEQPMW